MNTTANLGMNLPESNDYADIAVLNANFQKLDAVVAAARSAEEYDPAATYAVGSYCTHDGKLYRCTTAITAAEAWTAAHWAATSVGAELLAIIAALAGKVDAESALKSTGENPTNFKLNQVARIINEDARFPVNYGTYVCARSSKDNTGGSYALHLYCSGSYAWFQQTAELDEITLAGWHKLTTATPPTELDLPLESGIITPSQDYCKFSKTQDSVVNLNFNIRGIPASPTTIANLPSGYRPKFEKYASVNKIFGGACGVAVIRTTGEIQVYGIVDSNNDFAASASFDAGN